MNSILWLVYACKRARAERKKVLLGENFLEIFLASTSQDYAKRLLFVFLISRLFTSFNVALMPQRTKKETILSKYFVWSFFHNPFRVKKGQRNKLGTSTGVYHRFGLDYHGMLVRLKFLLMRYIQPQKTCWMTTMRTP